jgi:hypothetical protein
MLVELPIRTFADVASIGYGARIYCPMCYRQSDVEPTSPDLRERLFFTTRFRCTGIRHMGSSVGKLPCESLGHVHIVPHSADLVLPRQAIPYCSISCSTCVPYWEIDQARRDREPWTSLFAARGVAIACPTCGKPLHTTWHGQRGIPGTDGW